MHSRLRLSRDKLLSHHNDIVGIHQGLGVVPELALIRVVEGNHHISEVTAGDGLLVLASGTRDIDAEREVVIAVFLELLDFGIGHKVAHYALGVAVVNA
jgi:hypothetical protein